MLFFCFRLLAWQQQSSAVILGSICALGMQRSVTQCLGCTMGAALRKLAACADSQPTELIKTHETLFVGDACDFVGACT
jgi:hypothetical protein